MCLGNRCLPNPLRMFSLCSCAPSRRVLIVEHMRLWVALVTSTNVYLLRSRRPNSATPTGALRRAGSTSNFANCEPNSRRSLKDGAIRHMHSFLDFRNRRVADDLEELCGRCVRDLNLCWEKPASTQSGRGIDCAGTAGHSRRVFSCLHPKAASQKPTQNRIMPKPVR